MAKAKKNLHKLKSKKSTKKIQKRIKNNLSVLKSL